METRLQQPNKRRKLGDTDIGNEDDDNSKDENSHKDKKAKVETKEEDKKEIEPLRNTYHSRLASLWMYEIATATSMDDTVEFHVEDVDVSNGRDVQRMTMTTLGGTWFALTGVDTQNHLVLTSRNSRLLPVDRRVCTEGRHHRDERTNLTENVSAFRREPHCIKYKVSVKSHLQKWRDIYETIQLSASEHNRQQVSENILSLILSYSTEESVYLLRCSMKPPDSGKIPLWPFRTPAVIYSSVHPSLEEANKIWNVMKMERMMVGYAKQTIWEIGIPSEVVGRAKLHLEIIPIPLTAAMSCTSIGCLYTVIHEGVDGELREQVDSVCRWQRVLTVDLHSGVVIEDI